MGDRLGDFLQVEFVVAKLLQRHKQLELPQRVIGIDPNEVPLYRQVLSQQRQRIVIAPNTHHRESDVAEKVRVKALQRRVVRVLCHHVLRNVARLFVTLQRRSRLTL